MTHDDFIALVRQPESVKVAQEVDLKEISDQYPYFVQARFLYVKSLRQSNSIHYAANLKVSAIYSTNRRWFYYYLHPEKKLTTEPFQRNRNVKSSGDYFDMINIIESEGGDTNQSLKNLAERLKSARALVKSAPVESIKKSIKKDVSDRIETVFEKRSLEPIPKELILPIRDEISENNAKKLIVERKYTEAIEILRALNLNNPKKSVYFADQIRFLEKVIVNSKK